MLNRPLDYYTPSSLDTCSHGKVALLLGMLTGVCTYVFHALQSLSPLSPTMLVTFPLVAAIPILGLTSVIHGVDAFAAHRQRPPALLGMGAALVSMVSLAASLMGPH